MSENTFYLTTPIYYVNARPHIGHAYSTIVADVLARRHRLLGEDTYFLTGTDEHGQKIERSAAAAGIPPQQFADQVSKTFADLWARMGITHDQFIRTTDPKHKLGAQQLFRTLYERGDIYLSSYTGQYSIGEEMFVEGPPGTIGPDGRPTETVTEENFFFRLSKFQEQLIDLIKSDTLTITPDSSRNEVLSFIRGDLRQLIVKFHNIELDELAPDSPVVIGAPLTDQDIDRILDKAVEAGEAGKTEAGHHYVPGALKDLSISRSSFTWGIPVPDDIQLAAGAKEKHVIYVWLDALANYITALGYGSEDTTLFDKFWPADIHLVGKEITRFHCVYWPAFLLAAGLPTPKQVTANGWLLFDNSKMSKSKGNVVRTETILDAFGTLCPPPTKDIVILSEAKDLLSPEAPLQQSPLSPLSSRSAAEGSASPEPPQLSPSSPLSPLSSFAEGGGSASPEPPLLSPQATDRKGTASAGPSDASISDSTGLQSGESGTSDTRALAPGTSLPTSHDRDLFAADVLRYYLLREIPFGQDGSFSFDSLITRYNADLANGYGNLVSRTLNMLAQNCDSAIPEVPDYARSGIDRETADLRVGRQSLVQVPKVDEMYVQASVLIACETFSTGLRNCEFSRITESITNAVGAADAYISAQEPWKTAKLKDAYNQRKLHDTLYTAAESIRIITALLYPILPYATARVWQQLGLGDIEAAARNGELKNLQWGGLKPGTKLGPLGPIFPRADKGLAQIMIDKENDQAQVVAEALTNNQQPASNNSTDPAAPPRTSSLPEPSGTLTVAGSTAHTTGPAATPSHSEIPGSGIFAQPQPTTNNEEPTTPQITIDDFAKIELRVAQITLAERIPKADKLLRLEVDLGPHGTRQILSGIAEFYTPEELTGRRIVVITNLAPRKMRGLESHGMLLAASDGDHGKPYLATCGDDIALGSRLK